MKKRFSKEFLFKIRNHIPIDVLISQALKIPCKSSEGYFRFLCPVCREFNTATDPRTNLARCFLCKQKFNTIEIVKECNQFDFVQAVLYLDDFKTRLSENAKKITKSSTQTSKTLGLESIGSILKKIQPVRDASPHVCMTGIPEATTDQKMMDRISQLENQLRILTERIQVIEKKMC